MDVVLISVHRGIQLLGGIFFSGKVKNELIFLDSEDLISYESD